MEKAHMHFLFHECMPIKKYIERRENDRIVKNAEELRKLCAGTTEGLEFFVHHIRTMKVFSDTAKGNLQRNKRLYTSCSRMRKWAKTLLNMGNNTITEGYIEKEIALFDEKELLRAEEIWAAPDFLREEAYREFCLVGEEAVSIQNEWYSAELFAENGGEIPPERTHPAFFEHVLKMAAELESTELREKVEKRLALIGRSEESCILLSGRMQAQCLLKLGNLLSAMYTLDKMDWADVFARVSFTEKALIMDPAGIYNQMDEDSKDAIRRECAHISRATGFPERVVALKALEIAKEEPSKGITSALYTDDGRIRLSEKLDADRNDIRSMAPDRGGKRFVLAYAALFACLMIFLSIISGAASFFAAVPAVWLVTGYILRYLVSKFIQTRPLLKLDIRNVPEDAKTLVVIPALIASAERGRALVFQLETHAALDKNKNVDFLLLGDFSDSQNEHNEEDTEILTAVNEEIRLANLRSDRERFYYLNRNRTWNEADGKWMGHERKRGALTDLNHLILTGENRFLAEGSNAARMYGGYRYVITMDADTEMIPGTIERLIGTIHHPLNMPKEDGSGFAVIQPRMEFSSMRLTNRFMQLFAGDSGTDTYTSCASDLYQDFTGNGIFSGKGIYDVRAFYTRLDGAFEDGTILSHDMIEGIVSSCAYAGDVVVYEGIPSTPQSYLKRLERWTRGDWQLLKYVFGKIHLTSFDRFKVIDNCIRSLAYPSIALMMIFAVWFDEAAFLIMALAALFLPCVFSRGRGFCQAAGQLLLLPSTAVYASLGACRALYRMLISKKGMLEWVTAADADKESSAGNTEGIALALLLIPALMRVEWILYALVLAFAFVMGKPYLRMLSRENDEEPLSTQSYALLMELARETWRYFDKYVPLSGNGLPPDNVQLDPPKGEAFRTSPTNIGLYLVSCISANELGLIDESEMLARIRVTLKTLDGLSKWNGLIYNWYDTQTLEAMKPRYVSSVDCGNLLSCLVLVRNYIGNTDERVKRVVNRLIADMDFSGLYNKRRKLFRIGYDLEHNRASESYYDLLASEARILSYVTMAEKGIESKHWARLGRPVAGVHGKGTLLSWSGTMFEYMMPFLFMPSAARSLLGVSAAGVIRAQMQDAARHGRPWGVSECAYRAFDADMNYQYRAFGIDAVSISPKAYGNVIAPYATMLALRIKPKEAVENLKALKREGLKGMFGMYEAADYTQRDIPETVYCYMTHHQGMALCALCNALTGNRLNEFFMAHPRERALSLLLNEKQAAPVLRFRRKQSTANGSMMIRSQRAKKALEATERNASAIAGYEGHLLFGGGADGYIDNNGNGYYRKNGIYANMFHGDSTRYDERILPRIYEDEHEVALERAKFDAGYAEFSAQTSNAAYTITVCISPEDGRMLMRVTAKSLGGCVRIGVRQSFRVALANADVISAHPVFSSVFIRTFRSSLNCVTNEKRPRRNEGSGVRLEHSLWGIDIAERDRRKLRSRTGLTDDTYPQLFAQSAVEGEMWVSPERSLKAFFSLSMTERRPEGDSDYVDDGIFQRALTLSNAHMRTILLFLSIPGNEYRLLDKASRFLIENKPILLSTGDGIRITGRELWPFGISGERPILLMYVNESSAHQDIRRIICAHEFYGYFGIRPSLVFVYASSGEYCEPIRDAIDSAISASHLNASRFIEGGVFVIEKARLDSRGAYLLEKLACLSVKRDFLSDVRACIRCAPVVMATVRHARMRESLPDMKRIAYNGYGGYLEDGRGYAIDVLPGRDTPAPWINVLSNEEFGAIITEKGGGFLWHGNSRMGRLTPFDNEPASSGYPFKLFLLDEEGYAPFTPMGEQRGAYRVLHMPGETVFESETDAYRMSAHMHVGMREKLLYVRMHIENTSNENRQFEIMATVDFLMGASIGDKRLLKVFKNGDTLFAQGKMDGLGYAALKGGDISDLSVFPDIISRQEAEQKQWIRKNTALDAGKAADILFLIGWAKDEKKALETIENYSYEESHAETMKYWNETLGRVKVDTRDFVRNALVNRFLKYQTLACRVFAKTGMYQPGGAIGMRDQLQDMLSVLYMQPDYVRQHILDCAAHQFRDGDGMHWWHAPRTGVRTRISDDILFLPYVTSEYIRQTGDSGILMEIIPFLENEDIPEGREDWYGEGRVSKEEASLHEHIMRAFRRADKAGNHGLAKMGTGDWNDGMNRIGDRGDGESVWLSEFLSYTALEYAFFAPEPDKKYLKELSERMKVSVENSAWDGGWYLRAFDDDGNKIGSKDCAECRIDGISQAWAVINRQDPLRAAQAIESAREHLVDDDLPLIRLLTPPFTGNGPDPGYIAEYPAGIRENGGQYTHAACWLVLAYAKLNKADMAWKLFDMLLPSIRTDTEDKVLKYRGEPYVIAADISGEYPRRGVCGWTWYTGAAAWAVRVMYESLIGLKIEGSRVKMQALLPSWMDEVSAEIREGESVYRLRSVKGVSGVTIDGNGTENDWIELTDDGHMHDAVFPALAQTEKV